MGRTGSFDDGPGRQRVAASDLVLLDRIGRGDRDALSELYRQHFGRLSRFVARMTRSAELVEEIVNDTLMVVWEKAAAFEGRSKVSTWMFGIAYRKALKALEKQGRMPECSPAAAELADLPDGHSGEALVEQREWLQAGMARLTPEHRLVIEAVYFLGLSCAETAEIAGCPVNTVKTRMFYARRQLREWLPRLGGDAREAGR